MDRLIDRYPYKKILYLNWYEAAIAHLLLFKYYVEKYSQNIYFLISEQGIMLKAVTLDSLKKVDDQIAKFFTARIQELQLSGSTSFYNNILEDIKEQTEKLKDSRDCPYINLVYSEKLRNSCMSMRKLGYNKPYENWEYHERERKGFCFLLVRPQHRWKQIATNVYALARKRESSNQKNTSEMLWPVQICYEKFIWFYLKDSFKKFKKSLEIKENKLERCLTIVIKNDIQELTDLEKQIQTLTFFYRPTKPKIPFSEINNKILVLSPLEIEKITELVYHQFGLSSFAKQLRKKMTGHLIIGSSDAIQCYQTDPTLSPTLEHHNTNYLHEKQDIIKIQKNRVKIVAKLGRRHHIVQYEDSNFVQMKVQKAIEKTQYEQILKLRLPCIPRYYYWYEQSENNNSVVFLLRQYYPQKFMNLFQRANTYSQAFLLNSLINIICELHQKSIYLGSCLSINNSNNSKIVQKRTPEKSNEYCVQNGQIYVTGNLCDNFQGHILVQPGLYGTKEEDAYRLGKVLGVMIPMMHDKQLREEISSVLNENQDMFTALPEILEQYLQTKG